MIQTGDLMPPVSLTAPDGTPLALRDYLGKPLVLYFYPKDDTPGCTTEAQDFSRLLPEFRALGAEVLAVSRDTPAKHRKFSAKHGLTVPLASDETGAVTEAFGVWVEKTLYGKVYMGIDRSTWLFGADGRLLRQWRKVRVSGHAAEVLAGLHDLV